MDIPLRRPIMTTSHTDAWIRTAKFTEIVAGNPLAWGIILSVIASVVCSAVAVFFMMSRLDGRRWIGWSPQTMVIQGKTKQVFIPLYMTPEDLKDLGR